MPKSERKYRYRVSKKLFKYYNEQNYFMLNGISRLISKYPFANLFSQEIFAIKNKRQEITEEFLISQVIPKYLNFFQYNLHSDSQLHEITLSETDIHWVLTQATSKLITPFLTEQISNSLIILNASENFKDSFAGGVSNFIWKISDNLMFMNNDWSTRFPTWHCAINSPYYVCNLLFMQLSHGLVILMFKYPNNQELINKQDFINPVMIF